MIFMSLEQRATIQYYMIVLYFSVIDCSNCNALHLYCIVFCQSGTKKLQYILTFLSLIALCCIVFYQFGKEMIFMGSMERVPTKLHSIAIFFNSTAQYSFASAMCMHDMHNMQMSNIFGTYLMYYTVDTMMQCKLQVAAHCGEMSFKRRLRCFCQNCNDNKLGRAKTIGAGPKQLGRAPNYDGGDDELDTVL